MSDFPFTFDFHALEKEMATHSSVLAWRIPGMGEPGGLPPTGLHRVGHNRRDLAATAAPFSCGSGSKESAAMQETQVPSLGWEDTPEKEMATDSSVLAWVIAWTEKLGGLQSMSQTPLSD